MSKNIKDEFKDTCTIKYTEKLARTGADLKKALDAWDQLSENQDGNAISADEQMLQDMQNLLKQLQIKIEEFNR